MCRYKHVHWKWLFKKFSRNNSLGHLWLCFRTVIPGQTRVQLLLGVTTCSITHPSQWSGICGRKRQVYVRKHPVQGRQQTVPLSSCSSRGHLREIHVLMWNFDTLIYDKIFLKLIQPNALHISKCSAINKPDNHILPFSNLQNTTQYTIIMFELSPIDCTWLYYTAKCSSVIWYKYETI